jgi:hypothetical protein
MSRSAFLGAALCIAAGCVGSKQVAPTSTIARLEPDTTIELGSSAAGICQDLYSLLVLENSGTRILRYDFRIAQRGILHQVGHSLLAVVELDTLPLTTRVTAPAGIAADRFYIYVYDDHALYRMAKDKLDLEPWLGNVRVAGLAGFEPGTMLVSDEDHGAIWYKGLFGESRLFVSAAEIARPGAMVTMEDGTFAVLSPASKSLYFFDRSGVVTGSIPLPAACDLLAYNSRGTFCIGLRGEPQVWVLRRNRLTGFSLPDAVSPLSLAIVFDQLMVLDGGTKLQVYAIGS